MARPGRTVGSPVYRGAAPTCHGDHGVLQAMGVPSRLVVFPDENHWILKPQNAVYWHWEMQNWLSRYMGGTPTLEKPEFTAGG